jgi:amino acid transporter
MHYSKEVNLMSSNENNKSKAMTWQALCLMAYTVVWGFGNTVNGFANQGLKVIVSWMILFLFYFIPYNLMVGEMGATFGSGAGGVSSWIKRTCSSKLAFFAGWTFWVVNIPYLAQKPQNILIALGWAVFQNDQLTRMISPLTLQLISLGIFLFFMWYAAQGVNALKRIGSIAGSFMFVMSILYVLLVLAAPYITEAQTFSYNFDLETFMPNFNFEYMTTLSILVFAVGGCERIAPYVANLKQPDKEFPKAMIFMTIMVAITAVLGTFAMGLMFDPNNIPKDLMMNGAYYCFAKLGAYYGVGKAFVILYAICAGLGQAATLAISIDAPIKFLLSDVDPKFVPSSFTKINEKGVPVNGYKLTGALVSILIIVPALGIGDMTTLYIWLLRLNAICMPMAYLWVFFAYIALKRSPEHFESAYHLTKNKAFGAFIGLWCFAITAYASVMGMVPYGVEAYSSTWWFQVTMNVITPVILLGIGLVFPVLARRERAKLAQAE